MSDITFGIKLRFDGKELDGGVSISRQQFRALAVDAKNAGDATTGSFTSAARGVRSVSTQLEELKQGVIGYFTVTKSVEAVRWVLDQASAMQQLDARLKVATASAADYARAQTGVFEIANKYGAAIGETASAFARLNPVVAQMGGNAGITLKMLDGLSASLRLSGATAAETSAVLTQFAQAMGSGRVGGDEFRSMMENAEPLMRAVAAQMGKTTGELRQMSEEGKLTSSTFGNALLPAIDKLAKQAGQIPLGIGQAWQVLNNNMSRDFGREFGNQANIVAGAIKGISDHSVEMAAAVHAGQDALVALAGKAAVVAGGAALGAVVLTAGNASVAVTGMAAAVGTLNKEMLLFTAGAGLQRLESLSVMGKSGLVGMALWGGYEVGTFIGEIGAVRSALSNLLEPIFRAYDKVTGDAQRKAQIGLEDAKAKLDQLKQAKAGGQKSVTLDNEVLGMSSRKTVDIDTAIADAETAANKLQQAYTKIYAAPGAAAQAAGSGAGGAGRLSAAGEYSKLTADLKYREKLVKDHQEALLKLETAYRDKWGETADKDKKAFENSHQMAVTALLRQQKKELDSLPDVQDAKDTSSARADATIAAAKANAKRYGDIYKQELEQFRLSTADYLTAMATLERNALLTERSAVTSEKPVSDADKIRKAGKLQELDAQLADVDRKRQAAMEDAEDKASQALARLSVVAGKAIDPLDEAGRQFVTQFGATMQRAAADGNQAILDMGSAAWQAMAGDAQFKVAKDKYDALFADLQLQLEAVRQAAERDGGLLAGLSAAGKSDAIRDKLMPAINEAQKEMASFAGTSLVNQKAVTETKRQLGKIVDEGNQTWRKFTDQIETSLTDSLYRGFESGKGAGQAFVDSLRNTLKAAALKIAVQAIVDPVMGTMRGMMSSPGSAVGSGLNMLSTGSNMYSMFNGGAEAAYNNFALSSVGQWAGLSSTSYLAAAPTTVAGYGAGTLGSGLTLGGGTTGMTLGGGTTGLTAGSAALTEGATASSLTAVGSIGSSLAAAAPYIAAALVAAQVLGLFDQDVENPEFTSVYGNQTSGLPGLTKKGHLGNYGFAQAPSDQAGSDWAKQFLKFGEQVDNTGASLLGWDAGRMGKVTDRLTGVTQRSDGQPLKFAFPKLDEGSSKEVITEQAKNVLGTVLDEVGKGLGDVLRAMGPQAVDKVLAFAGAVQQAQQLFTSVGLSTAGLNKDLVDAMGGADDFAAGVKSLSGLFVSAGDITASQLANWRAEVASNAADAGVAVPKTVEEFKALVKGLDLTTEAGRKTFAALAKMEPAWESMNKTIEAITNNGISAWQNYQVATGHGAASLTVSTGMASTNNDKTMAVLASSFGVDVGTLDTALGKSGGLVNAAVTYWDRMDDAQKIAVTNAITARTAYIGAIKAQWDAQAQIVQAAYNNVAKIKDFSASLDGAIAGIQIDAGTLDKGTYLDGQIAAQRTALDTLYAGGASPDELLATAGKLRDLTVERYSTEVASTKEIHKFMAGVGDYLRGLKIGDLSPLTMGQKLGEAGSQLNDLLLTIESGTETQKTEARGKLTTSADAYLKLAQQYDPSTYATVFEEVQKALGQYADTGTIAEQQLAQQRAIAVQATDAVSQLQALKTQAGSWQASAQVKLDAAVVSLAPLSAKLDQLGAGGAIETAIRDLPKALSTIIASGTPSSATGSATVNFATGQVALGGKYAGTVVSTADIRSGVAGAAAAGTDPKAIYDQIRASGMSMAQVDLVMGWDAGAIEKWAKANNLPFFETGVERITKSGPAYLHEGEGVLNRRDNRMLDILNGVMSSGAIGGSDPALLGLLGDLVREVKQLRADNERQAALIAEMHARSNDEATGQVVEAIKAKQYTGRNQEVLL